MNSSYASNLQTLSLVASVFLSIVTPLTEEFEKPPNILFLFADDQRRDTIHAHGNALIQTPHLDRLVSQGLSFKNTYCMGSIHGAVCQPSRAMLLSGKTLYRVTMKLSKEELLPEVLRKRGYVTFGTGKWHNGAESFARSFDHGQNVFLGGMSDHTKVPIHQLRADGSLEKVPMKNTFSSELFADAAVGFINRYARRQSIQPFFAYVAFTSPHDPRQPPGQYRTMYQPDDIPLPPNFLPQHPFHNGWMTGRDEALASWPRRKSDIQSQIAEYYGMITHLDAQVGRIVEALTLNKLHENTLIVYAADHGLAVGSHGLLGKQNLYEHSMGTPFILAGPGIPANKSSDALVYLSDIYPTLCDLTGAAIPSQVEGKSLLPVIHGQRDSVRQSLFTTYEAGQRAVRDDRWKLIRYPHLNKTQLFDLHWDPHELNDLSNHPAHGARVETMMALLSTWQDKTGDTVSLTTNTPKSAGIEMHGRRRRADSHQPDWIVEKYFNQ